MLLTYKVHISWINFDTKGNIENKVFNRNFRESKNKSILSKVFFF